MVWLMISLVIKLNPIITELFIKGRELNISFVLLRNLILLGKKILDKLCTLFYDKNSEQTRASTKYIQSFIKYWVQRIYESLQKTYCKTILFLVINATLASNNRSRFKKNLLERIKNVIMTIDDKIKDEKL